MSAASESILEMQSELMRAQWRRLEASTKPFRIVLSRSDFREIARLAYASPGAFPDGFEVVRVVGTPATSVRFRVAALGVPLVVTGDQPRSMAEAIGDVAARTLEEQERASAAS